MFKTQNVGQSLPSINFENMNYRDHEMIINSPRSVHICQINHVNMDDLYFFNFFEYRQNHPEQASLDIQMQKSHYFHEEENRQLLLNKLIQQRRELINKENEFYKKQKEEEKEIEKKIKKELIKKQMRKNAQSENEKLREKIRRK